MLAVWFRCRIYSVLLPRYTTSLTTTLSVSICSTRFVTGRSKLKSLCRTRWLQRIDALHIFVDLFDSIINSFDQVTNNLSNWSRDSLVDATSLSKAMLNCDFIVTLHLVERYMSYTESLTKSASKCPRHNTSCQTHWYSKAGLERCSFKHRYTVFCHL